jgi:hypothetical protein
MLTGVSTRAQVAALAASDQPTEIAADAAGLAAALDRLGAAEGRKGAVPPPGRSR